MIDQLDVNLRELKRRVDARVGQMPIVVRAQTAETQALFTCDDGRSNMLDDQADLELDSHNRPAFLLPRGNDPTVAHTETKLIRPNPNPTAGLSQLQEATTAFTSAEQMTEHTLIRSVTTSIEQDPNQAVSQEYILAHPPAIRRQGFLHRILGRLLARRS